MASGCIVVGFSGFGGRDYMVGAGKNQNCVLVEEGNWLELGMMVEQVASELEKGSQRYDAIISCGMETSGHFGKREDEAQALEQFFRSLGQRPEKNE
jgi:hypothetical protein